jgi:hypothetical protein
MGMELFAYGDGGKADVMERLSKLGINYSMLRLVADSDYVPEGASPGKDLWYVLVSPDAIAKCKTAAGATKEGDPDKRMYRALTSYTYHQVIYQTPNDAQTWIKSLDPYGDLTPRQRDEVFKATLVEGYKSTNMNANNSIRPIMDPPPYLSGTWKVTISVDNNSQGTRQLHAWLTFKKNKNEYTIATIPGKDNAIEWCGDIGRKPDPESATRTRIVENPQLIRDDTWDVIGNCTAYARRAWYYATGEMILTIIPDTPQLSGEIQRHNNWDNLMNGETKYQRLFRNYRDAFSDRPVRKSGKSVHLGND